MSDMIPVHRTKWLLVPLICLLFNGCTILNSGKPNLPRIYTSPEVSRPVGKNPIIVIPGVLGSRLVNRQTGEVAWPKFTGATSQLLALPITASNFADNRDDLVATEIVDRARFFRLTPEISFYDSLLSTLEQAGGYRHGDIDHPSSDGDRDTYYVFPYDWRRDNVESARLLTQKILKLKQQLNRSDLRFDILAHSMGGLVARYAAMYGDQDVLEATDPKPDWSGAQHFARLMMFGTPNSGSMDALSTLVNGYSVLGTNLPQLRLLDALDKDAVFTTPSAYQLLPHAGYARFYDEQLNPLTLDIYDAATWKRYGWSIAFDAEFKVEEQKRFEKARRKLKKKNTPEAETQLGEMEAAREQRLAAREPYLQAVLIRAVKFHRALDVASTPPPTLHFYLFGGDCDPTLEAAIVGTFKGERKTFFRVNRGLGKSDLRRRAAELLFAPGDSRVTRRSLFGLQLNGANLTSILPRPEQAIFHCEAHGDLPLNPTVQNNLLTVLMGNRY
jgi:pimeloyl-ACP methyl ester carboxylesterase